MVVGGGWDGGGGGAFPADSDILLRAQSREKSHQAPFWDRFHSRIRARTFGLVTMATRLPQVKVRLVLGGKCESCEVMLLEASMSRSERWNLLLV